MFIKLKLHKKEKLIYIIASILPFIRVKLIPLLLLLIYIANHNVHMVPNDVDSEFVDDFEFPFFLSHRNNLDWCMQHPHMVINHCVSRKLKPITHVKNYNI